MLVHETKLNNELEVEGCIIPNCEQRYWTMTSARTHFDDANKQNGKAHLIHTFSHNANVLVRNEIELYNVSSFLADFGGYLGLLLGESLISYLLWATHCIKKLIQKLKQNSKKDKERIDIPGNLQLKSAIEPKKGIMAMNICQAWQERKILTDTSPQTLKSIYHSNIHKDIAMVATFATCQPESPNTISAQLQPYS